MSYGAGELSGDVFLIKTDENGDEVWNRTYGGTNDDWGRCVVQTSDGGYMITGYTKSFGDGNADVFLIKTDENGTALWSKTYGGTNNDWGRCVVQTSDGGYIITSQVEIHSGPGDVWLIKTDENGPKIWDKTYKYSVGYCVVQTSDGGYIVTGYTYSDISYSNDFMLLKTDENGNKIWDKTYKYSVGYCVVQTSDGGYIVTGITDSFGAGYRDVWLIKTDENGNKIWDKTYKYSVGYCVTQTTDGGYIIGGKTTSFSAGGSDVWLIKISNSENSGLVNSSSDNDVAMYIALGVSIVLAAWLGQYSGRKMANRKKTVGKIVK